MFHHHRRKLVRHNKICAVCGDVFLERGKKISAGNACSFNAGAGDMHIRYISDALRIVGIKIAIFCWHLSQHKFNCIVTRDFLAKRGIGDGFR